MSRCISVPNKVNAYVIYKNIVEYCYYTYNI